MATKKKSPPKSGRVDAAHSATTPMIDKSVKTQSQETQRFGEVIKMPHGLGEAVVKKSVSSLNQVLADTITLRDMYGCESGEVCNGLDLTETNQRVLLHRARSRVRADLDSYFADD